MCHTIAQASVICPQNTKIAVLSTAIGRNRHGRRGQRGALGHAPKGQIVDNAVYNYFK